MEKLFGAESAEDAEAPKNKIRKLDLIYSEISAVSAHSAVNFFVMQGR